MEYIHRVRSGKTGEVLTSHLEDKIEALEEKKKGLKLDPSSDGLPFTRDELKELKGDMLNITRYGPWEIQAKGEITDFVFLLMYLLQARRREHGEQDASKKSRK
ncbi:hypothetical protein PGQ11_015205 [Apiospora arundinis]|uniref:Uncharacterized protein n=1 Tax=Apiospora arundinis TaxID=335852 RepID=A0ABR2HKP8_9PEZI